MPFYAEECASMLAVTFSGGDKMMRSIVSTCVPCAPLATPGTARTMLHPLQFPHSSSVSQGMDVPFIQVLPKQREGPVSQPCGSCPTPAQAAHPALLPRDAGARRAGRALGSLSHLAPASPLFWHMGLSQLNF